MKHERRQVVLTFDVGGLCNRIFPFANALAAAVEHGWQVVNPVFGRYSEYFYGTAVDDFRDSPGDSNPLSVASLPFWKQRYAVARRIKPSTVFSGYDTSIINIDEILIQRTNDSRLWFNGLYCIANVSFGKHSDLLRKIFCPVEAIRNDVERSVDAARAGGEVLVGVHIRHGDYAHHDGGMLFYDTSEYAELMRRMQELMPNKIVKFLVCSNEEQAKEDLHGVDWRPGPGSEVGDLYALAACDYIIGPPSTYTQWASFYGQVPRYMHTRKYIEKGGGSIAMLNLNDFVVHAGGYGRFVE